ncbi:phosphatidate cytidylyltransferase [Acidisoma sp. C75]
MAEQQQMPADRGRRTGRWGDLGKRVSSAAILAPLALACLWFGKEAWVVLIAIGSAGCAAEWTRLCGANPRRGGGALLSLGIALLPFVTYFGGFAPAALAALVLLFLVWGAMGGGARALWLAGGVPYLAPAAIGMIVLRHTPVVGRWDMLFLVLIIWASDIGAYVVGRMVGGPKLAPSISPGKTWSGAVGGLIAAALIGLAVALALGGRLPVAHAAGIAMLLGIASQLGDLLESGFKRHFGVKDSGRSIPGHGGLLDRLDGMLTAVPIAAVVAVLIGEGVWLWQ